ncbi:unnamed protein product [Schistosoma curassoni]|nr:unnamed protein product [Schistosoma curassoni]
MSVSTSFISLISEDHCTSVTDNISSITAKKSHHRSVSNPHKQTLHPHAKFSFSLIELHFSRKPSLWAACKFKVHCLCPLRKQHTGYYDHPVNISWQTVRTPDCRKLQLLELFLVRDY